MPTAKDEMVDPTDGLPVSSAGAWAMEKHREVARYVDATRGARAKWKSSAYIDLFSGPGRQYVEETQEFIDGSPLVAWKASKRHKAQFQRVLIADISSRYVEACETRLRTLDAPVQSKIAQAIESAAWARDSVDHRGLQLVFADPFNLRHLPWEVFRLLTAIPHIDFIVHFSEQDLARNFDRYFAEEQSVLDDFAPGWRQVVEFGDRVQMRGKFLEHWISLFKKSGFHAALRMPQFTTGTNVPLYRLVFLSRHPFPKGIWEALETSPQRPLFG